MTPRLLVLGMIATMAALAEGAASNWIPLSMVDDQQLPSSFGVLVLALFVVGTLIARAFGNRILARFGNPRTLLVSLLTAAVGVLLVACGTVVLVACAGVLLWGVGIGLVGPIMFSAAAAGDPEQAAQRVSAVSIMNYSGFLIGPALLGFVGNAFGLRVSFLLVALLLIVSTFVSSFSRERKHDHGPTDC